MKLEFSRQIFGKYSNITFHENLSSGSRVVSCGRTDGQTDVTKLTLDFSQFCELTQSAFFTHRDSSRTAQETQFVSIIDTKRRIIWAIAAACRASYCPLCEHDVTPCTTLFKCRTHREIQTWRQHNLSLRYEGY
jgi:hypothetical protein